LKKLKGVISIVAIALILLIAYADIQWLYPYMLFFLGVMMAIYGVLEIKEERRVWGILSFISAFFIFGLWCIQLIS